MSGVVAPRRILVLVALLVATSSVAFLLLRDEGYTVFVELDDAAGLRQSADVQIGGVTVGSVAQLEVTSDDDVRAELQLDSSAAPIGAGSRALVRSANLFGEKVLELRSGDPSRPTPSGATIPKQRTGSPVELDDLLDVLDADTRARLGILINASGAALSGRSADFNSLLTQLPATLDEAGALVEEFASDNQALAQLLTRSDRVLRAVAKDRESLGRLVENASGALSSFASRRSALGETIREAPATLAELRRTLDRLEALAQPLEPAAAALRSTASPLGETLRELPRFVRVASPALREARRASPALRELARGATPVLDRLRPVAGELRVFAESFEPVTDIVDAANADLLGTLEGWARATQVRDGLGHLFRNQAVLTPELITNALAGPEPSSRTANRSERRSRRRPDPPREHDRALRDPTPSAREPNKREPLLRLPGTERPPPRHQTEQLLDFLLGP